MRAFPLAALALLAVAACGGPSRVTFDQDHCLIDGRPATLDEVETTQSQIARRVLDHQPIYVAVTLAVILLAGASHLEKLWLLLAARRQSAHGLAERLRVVFERYRVHPVRYFGLVFITLALLSVAGGLYIYLDADKRASERALGQLQFCQLALKSGAEEVKLDEERKNLEALRSTVGDIKTLVDTLPPEEQRKAEALLGQMRLALGNQDRLMARSNAAAAAAQARSLEIQKELLALQQLPAHLQAVAEDVRHLDARTQLGSASAGGKTRATVGEAVSEVERQLAEVGAKVQGVGDRVAAVHCSGEKLATGKTLGETLTELAARPPPSCPTCRCEIVAAPLAGDPHKAPPRDAGAR